MNKAVPTFEPLISHYDVEHPANWSQLFEKKAPLEVEIGFGLGEILTLKAQENEDRNFIGIEENWERLYKTLKRVTNHTDGKPQPTQKNLKVVYCDARVVFERLFKPKSIDHIYSLFPCPWPKKSHVKHRLFNNNFLKLLNSRLKSKSTLQIVTDYKPYFDWIAEEIDGTGFDATTNIISPQFDTKFEKKWRELGQDEFYEVVLTKVKHIAIDVKKDIKLKTYRLKAFSPEKFQFENYKDDNVTVILKDTVYDDKRSIMLVLVVVAEQNLSQQIRIAIVKHKGVWKVCKADGQKFFPTPGVNQAIKCVYEAANR